MRWVVVTSNVCGMVLAVDRVAVLPGLPLHDFDRACQYPALLFPRHLRLRLARVHKEVRNCTCIHAITCSITTCSITTAVSPLQHHHCALIVDGLLGPSFETKSRSKADAACNKVVSDLNEVWERKRKVGPAPTPSPTHLSHGLPEWPPSMAPTATVGSFVALCSGRCGSKTARSTRRWGWSEPMQSTSAVSAMTIDHSTRLATY